MSDLDGLKWRTCGVCGRLTLWAYPYCPRGEDGKHRTKSPKRQYDRYNHYEYYFGANGELMKKPVKNSPSSPGDYVMPDDDLRESFPVLCSYLCENVYDDGSPRKVATLTLFVEDSVLKGALNDRDQDRSLYASGSTLQSVLEALEGALKSGVPAWRKWGGKGKK